MPISLRLTLFLYLQGNYEEAVEFGRQSVMIVREMNDCSATMRALPHLGLVLAASGRYDEALVVFDGARQFGREYEVWPFLARSIAMSAGWHLDVFDFAGNETLAEEARELARSVNFPSSVSSAGIDLLPNFARSQDVGRTEKLVAEVAQAVEQAAGFHGWQWKMRLSEARAEIALARGDVEEALHWADDAIMRSQKHGRIKYEVAGRETHGKALHALGRTHAAIAELRTAVDLARPIGDPAMLLRVATSLLVIDGDDVLASNARDTAQRIAAALPSAELRRRFEAGEPMQRLTKVIR